MGLRLQATTCFSKGFCTSTCDAHALPDGTAYEQRKCTQLVHQQHRTNSVAWLPLLKVVCLSDTLSHDPFAARETAGGNDARNTQSRIEKGLGGAKAHSWGKSPVTGPSFAQN